MPGSDDPQAQTSREARGVTAPTSGGPVSRTCRDGTVPLGPPRVGCACCTRARPPPAGPALCLRWNPVSHVSSAWPASA